MVTRKDVAKLAHVSPTSVSYVINNSGYVSKEKRERILEAIKTLGYQPNNIARSLKTKRSNLFVIIVNEIRNEFFANVAYAMEQFLSALGYTLLVYNAKDDINSLKNLINYQVDGIFVYSKKMKISDINMFTEFNIPTVIASNEEYTSLNPEIIKIHIGTYEGVKSAVHHLVENGHQRIAYLNGNSIGNDIRLKAYFAALKDDRVNPDDRLVFTLPDVQKENLKDLVSNILSKHQDVTAFIGSNDNIAIAVLSTVQSFELNVPKDYSIIGIGNIGLSNLIYPSLTTVSIPAVKIGEIAARLLVDMNEKRTVNNIYLDTELIIRKSTGVCRNSILPE